MFTTWLSEQDDRDGGVGDLARLVNRDINNGCMPHVRNAQDIVRHVFNHHPKLYLRVRDSLASAMKEYSDLSENYKNL